MNLSEIIESAYSESRLTIANNAWRNVFIIDSENEIESLLKRTVTVDHALDLISHLFYLTSEVSQLAIISLYEGKADAGALIGQFARRQIFILETRLALSLNGIGGMSPPEVWKLFLLCLYCSEFKKARKIGSIACNSVRQEILLSDEDLRRVNKRLQVADHGDEPASKPTIEACRDTPVCGFCIRLCKLITGELDRDSPLPIRYPGSGAFEELFSNWDAPNDLADSLMLACDDHLENISIESNTSSDVYEYEFHDRPYNVIPFEILAYRNVRRKMGLETPFPAHPLLDSPFVKNLPDELPPCDDPLLNEVIAAVRKVLPDV